MRLPIGDLPPAIGGLKSGRIYGIVAEDFWCIPLIWPILAMASQDRPAILITPVKPEAVVSQAAREFSGVRQALASGAVRIFSCGDDSSLEADGARLQAELQHFGIERDALVVFLGVPSQAMPSQAEFSTWRRWAREKRHTVMFAFQRQDGKTGPEQDLLRASEEFSGLARLRSGETGPELDVFHWFDGLGVTSGQHHGLSGTPGRWMVRSEAHSQEKLPRTGDEELVFVEADALSDFSAPSHWQVFDTLEALLDRAANAQAATCILCFDAHRSLAQLLPTVFRLRRNCGKRLKIVVRERKVRLRYSQESLLIHLGANLVVPAEVGHSRFLSQVESIQDQLFQRSLPESYEEAVSTMMPIAEQGYLQPTAFIDAVQAALARSTTLGVQCVLVQLSPVYGLQPVDALRYCVIKRAGDICSADDQTVYLFLFACRESDTELALHRLFRLPVTEIFEAEVRHFSSGVISSALEALAGKVATNDAPDLCSALKLMADKPAQSGGTSSPQNQGIFQREAPPSAIRKPFRLGQSATPSEEQLSA